MKKSRYSEEQIIGILKRQRTVNTPRLRMYVGPDVHLRGRVSEALLNGIGAYWLPAPFRLCPIPSRPHSAINWEPRAVRRRRLKCESPPDRGLGCFNH